MDNDEGNVAARSRALFEQLRALRGRGSAPDEGRAARGAPPDSEPVRAAPPRPQEQAGTTKEPAADRPPEQGGAVGTEPPGAAGESSPGWSDEPGVGPAAPAAGDAASVAVAGPAPGDGIDGRQAPEPEHAPDEPEAPGEGARTPLVDLSGTGVGPILGDPPTAHPPVADEHGRHPAADLPLPRVIAIANQKGGVGQDDHRGQPGRGAGRARLPHAGRRPRPPGQRHHRPGRQRPQPRARHLRRLHARGPARRLRRADQRPQPLRGPGHHRSGRRRDRAGPGVQPGAAPAPGARRGRRRLRLHAHRLPAVARPAHRQRPGGGDARCSSRSSASTTRSRV